jgi:hypothetical protein
LCPFAKGVQAKGQVHYVASHADNATELLDHFRQELQALHAADPALRDTTLLIAPHALADFLDFNDFVDQAERMLRKMRLDGDYQIASFHPRFQFADEPPDDLSHYTNRAPYPTLHLLREGSMDRAVASYPDAALIFEKNIQTLRALGAAGWQALGVGPAAFSDTAP